MMKTSISLIAAFLLFTGSALAQMGGGHMGGGGGMGGGHMGGGSKGGAMMTYLDVLNPLTAPEEARTAIEAYLNTIGSDLQIVEIWEYEAAYKAEISDSSDTRLFDLLADKLTGLVAPEMGPFMMFNRSCGISLSKMHQTSKKMKLTPDDATKAAQDFIDKNPILDYTLQEPEVYPGFYKFHTTDSDGNFGIDILVSGYDGKIWMNTLLGAPIGKY